MSTDILLREAKNGVLTLTLNRPQRRNALSGALIAELRAAIEEAAADDSVRCMVLTGAGERAFCSGADLQGGPSGDGPLGMHEERRGFLQLVQEIRASGVPMIARVGGHVAAGGLGLMLAADIIIAADDVHFSTPEVKVGLFPMMIMALISRSIGEKRTLELVLTGERISSAKAESWGLINRVVPRAELDAEVDAMASRIAALSPAVLRLGRNAFYRMQDMPMDDALEYLASQLTLNTLSEDAVEGMMAFIQKREPEWKGR